MVTCQIISPDDADVYLPGPVPSVQELQKIKNELSQKHSNKKTVVVAMVMQDVEDDFDRVSSVFGDAELFHVIMCFE